MLSPRHRAQKVVVQGHRDRVQQDQNAKGGGRSPEAALPSPAALCVERQPRPPMFPLKEQRDMGLWCHLTSYLGHKVRNRDEGS